MVARGQISAASTESRLRILKARHLNFKVMGLVHALSQTAKNVARYDTEAVI